MEVFARRYHLQGLLGQGGFGVVWQAHDENLDRDVALKFFRPGFPPGLVFREAQLHVALSGPRVLEIFDADIYNDVPYIVSAIADAGSAMDRVSGTCGVWADAAVRWTRHLLSGLEACHGSGLLHRDVKPGNLFLANDDSAMLGDFGVVDRMVNGVTPAQGTTAFHPPETVQSGTMTRAADVYAAGLTLWMLLTGRHPFLDPTTDPGDFPALIAEGVPRLRDQAPHIPNRLARVVEAACARSVTDRYQSAAAMDEALGGLPRFPRLWEEVAPHPDEHRRWVSTAKRTETSGFVVSVRQSGRAFEVETRRAAGAGQRSRDHCIDSVRGSELARRLRRIFDELAR